MSHVQTKACCEFAADAGSAVETKACCEFSENFGSAVQRKACCESAPGECCPEWGTTGALRFPSRRGVRLTRDPGAQPFGCRGPSTGLVEALTPPQARKLAGWRAVVAAGKCDRWGRWSSRVQHWRAGLRSACRQDRRCRSVQLAVTGLDNSPADDHRGGRCCRDPNRSWATEPSAFAAQVPCAQTARRGIARDCGHGPNEGESAAGKRPEFGAPVVLRSPGRCGGRRTCEHQASRFATVARARAW